MSKSKVGLALAFALSALATAACIPAATKSMIRDEDVGKLQADTKAVCMVGAKLGFPGALQEVRLATVDGELVTEGVSGGLMSAMADGFIFVNVPKGPFRVSKIHYQRNTGKLKKYSAEYEMVDSFFGEHHGAGGKGRMPPELSGTCAGGFVWLGTFMGKEGGLFSSPSLELKHLATAGQTAESMINTKKALAASPWAAEIDHPAENKPLAEDAVVEKKAPPPTARPEKPKTIATLNLVSPGAEPRKALRYAAAEGDKRSVDLSVVVNKTALTWSLGSLVAKSAEAGRQRYTYLVEKSSVALNEGITGWVEFDDRGLNGDNDYTFSTPPKSGAPTSAVGAVASTSVPFPAEPVGVGATWQVTGVATGPTYTVTSTTDYKLESFDGGSGRVSFTVTAKTMFNAPIKMGTRSMAGSAIQQTGEATFNLAHLVPDSYRASTLIDTLYGEGTGAAKDPDAPAVQSDTKLDAR